MIIWSIILKFVLKMNVRNPKHFDIYGSLDHLDHRTQ
jgi:hypothetical protein